MTKKLVVLLLKYGLGLSLLAWVIWRYWNVTGEQGQEVGLAGALERPFHPWPYAGAAAVCLASLLLTNVRWYVLVRAQGLPFTLGSAMRLGMIGSYFNIFLPGSVGGDIFKATFIAREQSRRTVAVATVLLDRVIGLCGLVWLLALLGGFFWCSGLLQALNLSTPSLVILETILLVAAGIALGSIVFWLIAGLMPQRASDACARRLARIPKIGGMAAEFWRAAWMYRSRGKSVVLALVLAMIGQLGFVLCFYLASTSLNPAGDIPSLLAHYIVVPVGTTVQASVPLPGGIGGGEFAYGKLYELMNCDNANGVLASLAKRSIEWLLGIGFFMVYLQMKPRLKSAYGPGESDAA